MELPIYSVTGAESEVRTCGSRGSKIWWNGERLFIFNFYFSVLKVHGRHHALWWSPQVEFGDHRQLVMCDRRHGPCGENHGLWLRLFCSFSLSGRPHDCLVTANTMEGATESATSAFLPYFLHFLHFCSISSCIDFHL